MEPTTISMIGDALKALLEGVGLKKVFGHDPTESELAMCLKPAGAVIYKAPSADKYTMRHKWLVVLYFTPKMERATETEQELRETVQAVYDAFENNQTLNHLVVDAFPMSGETRYITGVSRPNVKLLSLAVILTVETTLVRR